MIKFPERIKQVLNFKGIGNSKIHPTDIDAILEFDEKYLIIYEKKKEGMKVPIGKKLLFERLADCWDESSDRTKTFIRKTSRLLGKNKWTRMGCLLFSQYRNNRYYRHGKLLRKVCL